MNKQEFAEALLELGFTQAPTEGCTITIKTPAGKHFKMVQKRKVAEFDHYYTWKKPRLKSSLPVFRKMVIADIKNKLETYTLADCAADCVCNVDPAAVYDPKLPKVCAYCRKPLVVATEENVNIEEADPCESEYAVFYGKPFCHDFCVEEYCFDAGMTALHNIEDAKKVGGDDLDKAIDYFYSLAPMRKDCDKGDGIEYVKYAPLASKESAHANQ